MKRLKTATNYGAAVKLFIPYYIYNYHEVEYRYDYSMVKIFHILNRGVQRLPQVILEFKLHHFFLKAFKILPKFVRDKILNKLKLTYISGFLVSKNKIQVIKNFIFRKKYLFSMRNLIYLIKKLK